MRPQRSIPLIPMLLTAISVALGVDFVLGQQVWKTVQFHSDRPAELEVRVVEDGEGGAVDLIRVTLGGATDAWFALDTGSPVAVLDDDFADRLGLQTVGSLRVNRAIDAEIRVGTTVDIGQLEVRDPAFVVWDIEPFLAELGSDEPIAGIIGYAFLQHAVVRIDYDESGDRIFLLPPAEFELPKPAAWIATELVDRTPTVRVELDGEHTGTFKIDTGKTYTMSIATHFAERTGLRAGREFEVVENRRIEGVSLEHKTTLKRIEFGGRVFDSPTVFLRVPGTSAAAQEGEADGILGRELLRHFDLVLDYSNARVALLPHRP